MFLRTQFCLCAFNSLFNIAICSKLICVDFGIPSMTAVDWRGSAGHRRRRGDHHRVFVFIVVICIDCINV